MGRHQTQAIFADVAELNMNSVDESSVSSSGVSHNRLGLDSKKGFKVIPIVTQENMDRQHS